MLFDDRYVESKETQVSFILASPVLWRAARQASFILTSLAVLLVFICRQIKSRALYPRVDGARKQPFFSVKPCLLFNCYAICTYN